MEPLMAGVGEKRVVGAIETGAAVIFAGSGGTRLVPTKEYEGTVLF
ncbi:hypothetical protein [Bartonella elizabethae]|nr:hypothetical protein [Bartonella elizabethae]